MDRAIFSFFSVKNHSRMKIILICLIIITFSLSLFASHNTFALEPTSDRIAETNFWGNLEDNGDGCGVYAVLNTIITILSVGIGIAGLIGITVAGIQLLTSSGNPAQLKKSQHRLFAIAIGLALYATMYAGIQFLIPGGYLTDNPQCRQVSDSELAEIKAKEAANRRTFADNKPKKTQQNDSSSLPKDYKKCMKKAAKAIRDKICKLKTNSKRIAAAAKLLAWPYNTSRTKSTRSNSEYGYMGNTCYSSWSKIKKKRGKPTATFMKVYDQVRPGHFNLCSDKWGNHTSIGASCDVFAATVVKSTGYDNVAGFGLGAQNSYFKGSGYKKKWKKVSKPKAGDYCNKDSHSAVYVGGNRVAEAGYGGPSGGSFGRINKGHCSGMRIMRAIK